MLRELAGSVLGSRLAGTDLATGIEFWADYELTDQVGDHLFITSNADSDDVVQEVGFGDSKAVSGQFPHCGQLARSMTVMAI